MCRSLRKTSTFSTPAPLRSASIHSRGSLHEALASPPAPASAGFGHGTRRRISFHRAQFCYSVDLPTDIVPHQMRHTYGTEMVRAGVGFAAVMKLLGHTSPRMTMRYVDVTLTDLQREFELARSKPRHLAPQPKTSGAPLRTGLDGLIDSFQ